jgi:hypothetical protein
MLKTLLVAALSLSPGSAMPNRIGREPKRSRPGQGATLLSTTTEMLASVAEVLHLTSPAHVYSMNADGHYEALIKFLWTGDYVSAAGRFTESNPALVNFLETQSLDDQMSRPGNFRRGERGLLRSFSQRFEGVFRALFRARSQ